MHTVCESMMTAHMPSIHKKPCIAKVLSLENPDWAAVTIYAWAGLLRSQHHQSLVYMSTQTPNQ